MTIDEVAYVELKNKFLREYNRVECYRKRRKLTANVKLREEYRTDLTKTYNDITLFLHRTHLRGNFDEKIECQNRQINFKLKLKEAFKDIKVNYEFSEISFDLIDINKVVEILQPNEIESDSEEERSSESENTLTASETVDFETNSQSETNSEGDIYETAFNKSQSTSDFNELNESIQDSGETLNLNRSFSLSNLNKSPQLLTINEKRLTNFIQKDNRLNRIEMAETFEYISNISRIIRNNFDGDVNQLDAFIAAIELANAATGAVPANQLVLVNYIRTKLVDRAVDFVPPNTINATDAIAAIRAKAKGDNTQVVLGRLLALRSDKNSMQKFQESAELLAEKLRKSYISDGIPADLANKMTIEKTVEMCHLSARTPLVKSVLASAKFDQPKEVLAKFITEASVENTEVKILAFRNNGRGGNFNNNRRSNFNRGGYNRGGYNNNFNNYNNNGQNRNNNGFRGRGRGRGRGNNYQNYNQRNFNNFNNQNGNRNDRYVRAIQENPAAPTAERGNQNQNVELRQA